jgi:hypothetical protein
VTNANIALKTKATAKAIDNSAQIIDPPQSCKKGDGVLRKAFTLNFSKVLNSNRMAMAAAGFLRINIKCHGHIYSQKLTATRFIYCRPPTAGSESFSNFPWPCQNLAIFRFQVLSGPCQIFAALFFTAIPLSVIIFSC